MTVQVIINADNAHDAMKEIKALALYGSAPESTGTAVGALKESGAEIPATPVVEVQLDIEDAIAEVKAEKPKRAAKAKSKPAPVEEPPAAEEPPADPEVEAQDAKDEAEDQVNQSANLTHDDVRNALKAYLEKFGMPAATEDGQKVFAMLFGDKCRKVSDVPVDQESLRKAVEGLNEMLAKNPFKREA